MVDDARFKKVDLLAAKKKGSMRPLPWQEAGYPKRKFDHLNQPSI